MITSAKNERVREVVELLKKAKARREQGVFVAEGIRMLEEIPADRVERLFVSESFLRDEANERLAAGRGAYEIVSDSVFAAMSDTRTPQGVMAVVRRREYAPEEILGAPGPAHLLLLEGLQDPGNLGTILRSGEGAGVTGILMSADTVDIYNPKVIRSTMGSVLRVPFAYVEDLRRAAVLVKKSGARLFAAHLAGRNNYEEEDYTCSTGFLIGNEGNGLSEALAAEADARIRIPMAGCVESLNAAVAASVLMFEAARQRRRVSTGKE